MDEGERKRKRGRERAVKGIVCREAENKSTILVNKEDERRGKIERRKKKMHRMVRRRYDNTAIQHVNVSCLQAMTQG